MKLKYLWIAIAMLLFPFFVSAKEVEKTCYYDDSFQGGANNSSAKVNINKDKNTTCNAWITNFQGKSMNNSEDCGSWTGETKNTYLLNKECPYYALISYKAWSIGSANVFVSYQRSLLESKQKNMSNPSVILQNKDYDPDKIVNDRKKSCGDYQNHDECFYGVKDSKGNTCQWNISNSVCEQKKTCSEYVTESTCPKESHYGKCEWNTETSKCEKNDIFLCEDYNSEGNCPSKDEEGNSCKWNNSNGCFKVEEKSPANGNNSNNNSSNNTNNEDIKGITTGEICKSPNLKVPLKYIGWILSVIKIIIPLAIIALGIMDFMKAVASTKSDEMQKALKTVILRAIAGIIIFFIPMLVNFFFTLIDQWTDYNTYYSECTKCLYDPKSC